MATKPLVTPDQPILENTLDFHQFLSQVYEARYTGAITLHCKNGIPMVGIINNPVKIHIKPPKPRG